MGRACQALYPESRVCEAEEVMTSVMTPEPPVGAGRLAWVQTCGKSYPARGHFPVDDDAAPAPATDCHGWTTASNRELGMAIELGTLEDGYGGFVPGSCDLELVVACCSKQVVIATD
jgi:hypothetical protein